MSRSTLHRILSGGAIGVALLSSTACATLIEGIADEVQTGSAPRPGQMLSGPEELDLAAARSTAKRENEDEIEEAAGYQSAPTIDWTLHRYGSPFSISRALFEQPTTMGPRCRPAVLGLARVSWTSDSPPSRPSAHSNRLAGSMARPIADTGRFEHDLVVGSVSLGTLFLGDRDALAARYLASAARLGHQGHVCGESLSVSVWWSSDGSTITLLR